MANLCILEGNNYLFLSRGKKSCFVEIAKIYKQRIGYQSLFLVRLTKGRREQTNSNYVRGLRRSCRGLRGMQYTVLLRKLETIFASFTCHCILFSVYQNAFLVYIIIVTIFSSLVYPIPIHLFPMHITNPRFKYSRSTSVPCPCSKYLIPDQFLILNPATLVRPVVTILHSLVLCVGSLTF